MMHHDEACLSCILPECDETHRRCKWRQIVREKRRIAKRNAKLRKPQPTVRQLQADLMAILEQLAMEVR